MGSEENKAIAIDIVGGCNINVVGKEQRVYRCGQGATCRYCRQAKEVCEALDAKDAEIERLKAQLSASEAKRKVLAKFYKTGERYVEARHNQDDMHNAGYFSAQAAYAQAKLDIDATSALEAP